MKRIRIMDCTLRDGGWINNFHFGKSAMNEIVSSAEKAGVEYIELGYMDENSGSEFDHSMYVNYESLCNNFLENKKTNASYVVMIDYGQYPMEKLPSYNEKQSGIIDGIRLCFHKKDADDAIVLGKQILEKGYKLFMQPMVTTRYTDDEFKMLIKKIQSKLERVSGVYVVDSFGALNEEEICKRLLMADKELRTDIILGLHTHNNLNKSFFNAKAACSLMNSGNDVGFSEERVLVLDGSLRGMGKGAGNLHTEEIARYLNDEYDAAYDVEVLEELSGRLIEPVLRRSPWGYTREYELAARYRVTPTYVKEFAKEGYSLEEIEKIVKGIPENKKDSFDKSFVEKYLKKIR